MLFAVLDVLASRAVELDHHVGVIRVIPTVGLGLVVRHNLAVDVDRDTVRDLRGDAGQEAVALDSMIDTLRARLR